MFLWCLKAIHQIVPKLEITKSLMGNCEEEKKKIISINSSEVLEVFFF